MNTMHPHPLCPKLDALGLPWWATESGDVLGGPKVFAMLLDMLFACEALKVAYVVIERIAVAMMNYTTARHGAIGGLPDENGTKFPNAWVCHFHKRPHIAAFALSYPNGSDGKYPVGLASLSEFSARGHVDALPAGHPRRSAPLAFVGWRFPKSPFVALHRLADDSRQASLGVPHPAASLRTESSAILSVRLDAEITTTYFALKSNHVRIIHDKTNIGNATTAIACDRIRRELSRTALLEPTPRVVQSELFT
jgi:hypothetical protein